MSTTSVTVDTVKRLGIVYVPWQRLHSFCIPNDKINKNLASDSSLTKFSCVFVFTLKIKPQPAF